MKMLKNKKGVVAFDWIYGLIFLFALGLLFVVFNQVLTEHINPVIEDMIPDSNPAKTGVIADNNEFMSYWNFMPFIIIFIILTYWLVSALRKDNFIQQ